MKRRTHRAGLLPYLALALVCAGCWTTPSAHTVSRNESLRDAPDDPVAESYKGRFDEVAKGGKLFKMYCAACHNARPLGERPFANYEVATAHMRSQAYLTGKEYRQLINFMRRWHDVGPATPDVEPTPRRFYFSQPLSELRERPPEKGPPPKDKMPQ